MMDNAQAYVRTWELVLTHMLGWPAARIQEWVKRWEPELHDPDADLFYHEAPEYYVAALFIPADLLDTGRFWTLEGQVMVAIGDVPIEGGYDWDAAKARVAAVLAECRRRHTKA